MNDLIKNIPTLMTTTEDVYVKLGRWKPIIVKDLFNTYQKHMHPDSYPYDKIITPFAGLRVLTRSGEGLLGQSKERQMLALQQCRMAWVIRRKDSFTNSPDTRKRSSTTRYQAKWSVWNVYFQTLYINQRSSFNVDLISGHVITTDLPLH